MPVPSFPWCIIPHMKQNSATFHPMKKTALTQYSCEFTTLSPTLDQKPCLSRVHLLSSHSLDFFLYFTISWPLSVILSMCFICVCVGGVVLASTVQPKSSRPYLSRSDQSLLILHSSIRLSLCHCQLSYSSVCSSSGLESLKS